jgi:SMI1/KNR4 family protein SUKH-1
MIEEIAVNEVVVILLSIVALVVVAAVICWAFAWVSLGLGLLFGRFGRQPEDTPEEYRARRREPPLDVLAAHFGAPVPESLKGLYRNIDLLEQQNFILTDPAGADPDRGHSIDQFLPADNKALEEIPRRLKEPLFPFASDGFGNYYCVPIQREAQEPCPVYFWDPRRRTTPEEMKIADSLDEFLARPRRPRSGAAA